jgi:hypothetical protein
MATLWSAGIIFAVPHKKVLDSRVEARKIRLVAAHKATAPTKINPNNKEKRHVFYR